MRVSDPALAGYCVQFLRYELSYVKQPPPSVCKSAAGQKLCASIKEIRADQQRTFNLWHMYGLSLGMGAASEFLRGAAETNADINYVTTQAHKLPLSASEANMAREAKAAAASDPRIKAFQQRVARCERGPPL